MLIKNSFSRVLTVLFIAAIQMTLTSCLKTAAEIQREQEMEQILVSARESHSYVAELTSKNKELQEQMGVLQGRVDELQQLYTSKTGTESNATASNTEQSLKQVADIEELKAQVQKLQKDYSSQQELLSKLESQLKGMTATQVNAQSFDAKGKNQELSIEDAEKLLEDKKYGEVISACKELLNSKISDGKKNRCRFAQGLAYKELKQLDEGLLVLSQIYTDWPKSSLAPQALLEIGIILQSKKQEKEAQLMFKKLMSEYPKTSASKEAKKLLKP